MNTRNPLLAPAAHTVITASPAALIGIFEPDVQLAIWQRPVDQAITDYLEASRLQVRAPISPTRPSAPGATPSQRTWGTWPNSSGIFSTVHASAGASK
jgi:hypothetical protein